MTTAQQEGQTLIGLRQAKQQPRPPLILTVMALAMTAVLPACSDDPLVLTDREETTWEGPLKFIFVERAIVVPFYLADGEALLLRLSNETEFVDIGPLVEGDGINVANRLFHSAGTYRFEGKISDEEPDGVQLLSIPTRIVDVESITAVKPGQGTCTAYFGRLVPPKAGRDGFAPILPDYAEGKKGMFVHDGSAKCTIVPQGGELMSSITSDGSIDMNAEIDWARP